MWLSSKEYGGPEMNLCTRPSKAWPATVYHLKISGHTNLLSSAKRPGCRTLQCYSNQEQLLQNNVVFSHQQLAQRTKFVLLAMIFFKEGTVLPIFWHFSFTPSTQPKGKKSQVQGPSALDKSALLQLWLQATSRKYHNMLKTVILDSGQWNLKERREESFTPCPDPEMSHVLHCNIPKVSILWFFTQLSKAGAWTTGIAILDEASSPADVTNPVENK